MSRANVIIGIAKVAAVGNTLYAAMVPEEASVAPFGSEFCVPLRLAGAPGAATAWALRFYATDTAAAIAEEFNNPQGPYPLCNGVGVSDAQVVAAKQAMLVLVGSSAELEKALIDFVTANGYEVIPR